MTATLQAVSLTRHGEDTAEVTNSVRWLKRPVAREGGFAGGLLAINGETYTAESFYFEDDDSGHCYLAVDLHRTNGNHIRVLIGPDGGQCDCEHSTYRSVRCKHIAAVEVAIKWLEERERLEWEAETALERLSIHDEYATAISNGAPAEVCQEAVAPF